jgi:hypothetical protein
MTHCHELLHKSESLPKTHCKTLLTHQCEADLMEERSSSFYTLQLTLNGMGILDSLSKMKCLFGAYIAGALRAWLGLRFFEGSPAVSKAS